MKKVRINKLEIGLIILYFVVSTIEILAELYGNRTLILFSKPFIMPILIGLYFFTSNKLNYAFIIALFFNWIATLFFVYTDLQSIIYGTLFVFVYRIIVIYIVLKIIKFPSIFPIILGSLPFISIFIFVIKLAYDQLGNNIYLFITLGVSIAFLGGISLASYMLNSSKSNTYLLISIMLIAFSQFTFVLKMFYPSLNIFQPITMLLFTIGQFLLYKFVITKEFKSLKNQLKE